MALISKEESGQYPREQVGNFQTLLLVSIMFLLYSMFFREFALIVTMPEMDGVVKKVNHQVARYIGHIELESGKTISMTEKVTAIAKPGMRIKHEKSALWVSLDEKKIWLFRFFPILLVTIFVIGLALASFDSLIIASIALFLFSNRVGGFKIIYLVAPFFLLIYFNLSF